MNVLVAYATKYGSTRGVAERIAATLRAAGIDAAVQPIEQVHDITSFDAFVIGSTVYAFHWLKPAVRFVEQNQGLLGACPVWLFSVGPLGAKTVRCAEIPSARVRMSLATLHHRRRLGWQRSRA